MAQRDSSTRTQYLSRKAQIAHLAERGWSNSDIAGELGITKEAVQYHLRSLEQIWLETILSDISAIKARKIAELAAVKKAAWGAWDVSSGAGDTLAQAGQVSEVEGEDAALQEALDRELDAEPLQITIDQDGEGVDVDETTRIILERVKDPLPKYGPTATDFTTGRIPLSDETFEKFQEAGEARLERLRRLGSSPRLSAKKGQRPRGRPPVGGEPHYLRIIIDAIESERAILGLDAPKRTIDLRLTPQMIREMGDDELERLIEKVGGKDLLTQTDMSIQAASVDKTREITDIVPSTGYSEENLVRGIRPKPDDV